MKQPALRFTGRGSPVLRRLGRGLAGLVPILLMAACVTVDPADTVESDGQPSVSASLAGAQKHRLKRKVAIARFSNETLYGKSVLLGDKKSLIGKMTSDIFATRLEKSEKVILFERSDSADLLDALNKGTLRSLNLPADYLIVGSLSEFGRNTTGETGFMSRTKKQEAYARVNIRLVDVDTGRVIYAEEGTGKAINETGTVMGMGSKAGYDATLGQKAISAAISKLVSNVLENLMAQPWRSYVLSRDDGKVIIAGGAAQGIEVGDRFALIRRGKRVKNPQTNLMIELPGLKVATLEVVSLFGAGAIDQGSVCHVVSGEAPEDELTHYVVEEEK